MSRYPGPPPSGQGQGFSSAGVYPSQGMPGHMPSPQTVPPYNVSVQSPSQYVQQSGAGPSPTQGHYPHQSPQQPMMTGPGGYGQPMMHGMMTNQPVMQPAPAPPMQQQTAPPPPPQPQQHVQQSQAAPDDLGAKVKRNFANFEANLKTFLHEYSTILQMDDARLNSQPPEYFTQLSQNLVRRYEALLVSLDLFEANLRMLQDYSSTQTDFRRLAGPVVTDPRRVMGAGQGDLNVHLQFPGLVQFGRSVDPNQYQTLLTKMQTQIDSYNALREVGQKFLDSSSNNLNPTTK